MSLRNAAIAFGCVAVVWLGGCLRPVGKHSSEESNETTRDWIDGAYEKQGGTTPVHFVFRRETAGSNEDATFFGEIEKDGTAMRAEGDFEVGQDDLGTTVTLTLTDDAEAPELVQQAFSGTYHFLKIGKNDTILIRGEATGKTAHYQRVPSWCGTNGAKDCKSSVQHTTLNCEAYACSASSRCQCK